MKGGNSSNISTIFEILIIKSHLEFLTIDSEP